MIKLEDIARLASVSKTTASLVLNGKPGVSENKRQEILRIAKEKNYVPLRKIRKISSVTNQTTVRLISCSGVNRFTYNVEHLPYFNELINEFLMLAHHYPINLLINSISLDYLEEEFLALEIQQKSAAIILLGTDLPETAVHRFLKLHDTVIVIDACFEHINNSFIAKNNTQGAFIATEYLISHGHSQIGYAMANQRIQNFKERQAGFEAALKKHHLASKDYTTLVFPAHEIKSQTNLLKLKKMPTAYFCENDAIAISLIKSLQEKGITVPDDVSIIGFDNISESSVISPELTTIDISRNFLVTEALEKIIAILGNKNFIPIQMRINASLIERSSVKYRY